MQAMLSLHFRISLQVNPSGFDSLCIATGSLVLWHHRTMLMWLHVEIYRIVSSKALDNSEATQHPITGGKVLEISKSVDAETKASKCC